MLIFRNKTENHSCVDYLLKRIDELESSNKKANKSLQEKDAEIANLKNQIRHESRFVSKRGSSN